MVRQKTSESTALACESWCCSRTTDCKSWLFHHTPNGQCWVSSSPIDGSRCRHVNPPSGLDPQFVGQSTYPAAPSPSPTPSPTPGPVPPSPSPTPGPVVTRKQGFSGFLGKSFTCGQVPPYLLPYFKSTLMLTLRDTIEHNIKRQLGRSVCSGLTVCPMGLTSTAMPRRLV